MNHTYMFSRQNVSISIRKESRCENNPWTSRCSRITTNLHKSNNHKFFGRQKISIQTVLSRLLEPNDCSRPCTEDFSPGSLRFPPGTNTSTQFYFLLERMQFITGFRELSRVMWAKRWIFCLWFFLYPSHS